MSKSRNINTWDRLFYKIDRGRLWIEQDRRCKYCGTVLRRDELTMDHVIPISRTRHHSTLNCVVACSDCNHKKADLDEIPEAEPLDEWENVLQRGFARIDEKLLRFQWAWHPKPMGSFNKWRKYMFKNGLI